MLWDASSLLCLEVGTGTWCLFWASLTMQQTIPRISLSRVLTLLLISSWWSERVKNSVIWVTWKVHYTQDWSIGTSCHQVINLSWIQAQTLPIDFWSGILVWQQQQVHHGWLHSVKAGPRSGLTLHSSSCYCRLDQNKIKGRKLHKGILHAIYYMYYMPLKLCT